MNANSFIVHDFKPLFLTVEGIGPFRSKPFQLDFTDSHDEPCNIFLLMSQNGKGKTTLLDLMAVLMDMFEKREPEALGFEDLDNGAGKVQWDFYVNLEREGRREAFIFSLVAGKEEPWSLNSWGQAQLEKYGAETWEYFGFVRHASGRLEELGQDNERTQDLLAAIRTTKGLAPVEFEANPLTVPTLIYFSAYRDIPKVVQSTRGITEPDPDIWGYRPAHLFGKESSIWQESLESLLVWLKMNGFSKVAPSLSKVCAKPHWKPKW